MFGLKLKKRAAPAEVTVARLNARLQPVDRSAHFEAPLARALKRSSLGEIAGGGTQLADDGIAYCEIELALPDVGEARLQALISEFNALGAPKGSLLIVPADGREFAFGAAEGLALQLNGTDLPDAVYEALDFEAFLSELGAACGAAGKVMSFWTGTRETGVFLYGPSFEAMKAAIAPFRARHPLCALSRLERIA